MRGTGKRGDERKGKRLLLTLAKEGLTPPTSSARKSNNQASLTPADGEEGESGEPGVVASSAEGAGKTRPGAFAEAGGNGFVDLTARTAQAGEVRPT